MGGLANSHLRPPKEERSPFFPVKRSNQGPEFLLRPEMAGSLLPVAVAVFDERRKALGFSVAGGSSADTVAFARSEGTKLVLLTAPFIGRESGENSGAVWRPHSGHKLKLKKTPPAPGLSPGGGEVKRAHPLPGPLGSTRPVANGAHWAPRPASGRGKYKGLVQRKTAPHPSLRCPSDPGPFRPVANVPSGQPS